MSNSGGQGPRCRRGSCCGGRQLGEPGLIVKPLSGRHLVQLGAVVRGDVEREEEEMPGSIWEGVNAGLTERWCFWLYRWREGHRGQGTCVHDLPKQVVLNLSRMFKNIVLFDNKVLSGVASDTLALSNPILPVLQDMVAMGANRRRGEGGGTNRGRKGGGESGQQRVFDPQNRGRARRPRPQGGHSHYRAIRRGRRNPRRRRSPPRDWIKSITCLLLQRGVPILWHEARAQGTGWVRFRWGDRRGGVNSHGADWLSPTLPRLTCPLLVGHANVVRSEKGWHRAVTIEDFKKKAEHHPLNLGSGDRRGQLNGTPDKVGMCRGKELDPVDR